MPVCIFSLLRPPKELLNPKKKGSKIDPKINKFWTNFGVQMGLKSIPQNYSKKNQKLNQSKVVIICHDALKVKFQCLTRPL